MSLPLDTAIAMARGSAQALIAATDRLCALDAVAGDGDHGFAMAAASRGILQRLDAQPPDDPQALMTLVGAEFSKVGGSMGALLFVASEAATAVIPSVRELTPAAAGAALLGSAQEAITAFGGARPGDKSLLDAIDAARTALAAAPAGEPFGTTLRCAADAAEAGAAATARMTARIGRASRLGEIGKGSADAGATSFAICMRAMSSAYNHGGLVSCCS